MENYQEWTACQMHGHDFDEDGHCPDCGEHRVS